MHFAGSRIPGRMCCCLWLSPWKQWRRWLSLFSLYQTHYVCVATSKMWRQKVWHALLLIRRRGGGAGRAEGWLYSHDVRCKMKKAAARGCFERAAKLFRWTWKKSGVSPFRGYEIIISRRNWQYFWPNFNCTRSGPTRGASAFWPGNVQPGEREAGKLCLILYNIMLGVLRAGISAFL